MHKYTYIIVFLLVSCGGGGGGSPIIDSNNSGGSSTYKYTPPSGTSRDNCVSRTPTIEWAEEFSNENLDLSKWSYDEGCNNNGGGCNGNDEKQNYTSNDKDNLFIENGFLKIQPIYEQNTGSDNVQQDFTSAKIMTKDKFPIELNSRLSICFKLPEGTGMWPAVWMLAYDGSPWPSGGEIDLLEAKGRSYPTQGSPAQNNIISSAVHFGTEWPDNKYIVGEFFTSNENTFQDYFHSMTLIFQENKIDFYIDDESTPHLSINPTLYPLNQYIYPFNKQFYLMVNVAVGGNFDSGRLEPSEFCSDSICSNFSENPDKKRLLIDWIEYEKLGN